MYTYLVCMLCVAFVLHIIACLKVTVSEASREDEERGIAKELGEWAALQGLQLLCKGQAGFSQHPGAKISVSSSDTGSRCFPWRWRGGAICRLFFAWLKKVRCESWRIKVRKLKKTRWRAKQSWIVMFVILESSLKTDCLSSLPWLCGGWRTRRRWRGGVSGVCEVVKYSTKHILTFQRLVSKW